MQATAVLYSLSDQELKDGEESTLFKLEIYQGISPLPKEEYSGLTTLEDVNLLFVSDDKNVSFKIYLDELNETSLNKRAALPLCQPE